jgi:hypothetical protein
MFGDGTRRNANGLLLAGAAAEAGRAGDTVAADAAVAPVVAAAAPAIARAAIPPVVRARVRRRRFLMRCMEGLPCVVSGVVPPALVPAAGAGDGLVSGRGTQPPGGGFKSNPQDLN